MQIFVSAVIGLALWLILWAINVKAIDAFLLTIVIVLGATVAWMVGPSVK